MTGPMVVSRRWLDVARAAFLEELYRGRSVLCVGVGVCEATGVVFGFGVGLGLGVDVGAGGGV